ncbi:hypothetical protein GQ457_02G018390 [Hibiscus cannabinus]
MIKTKPISNEAKWPDVRISINNISKWSPSPCGLVKFNTYDVVVGSFGAADNGALRLLSNSTWSHSVSLALESDSKLTFEWLTQPHKAPEVFKSLVSSCFKLCENVQLSI